MIAMFTNLMFQLAFEAAACEEKEEKLVTDAVKHLTEANTQIKDLHSQFTNKVSGQWLRFNFNIFSNNGEMFFL